MNGKLGSETTGTSDRQEAERKLAGCKSLQSNHAAGNPISKLYEALNSASGNGKPVWSLKLALENWVAEARKTTAQGTADRYAGVATAFAEALNATDSKPLLRDVTTEHVRGYLDKVLTQKSAATTNQERRILRVFWRRAIANNQTTENAVVAVKSYRDPEERKRRPLTLEEVRLIFSKAEGFWKFAILCGFFTGLRISDIALMPVGALDLKQRVIRITTKKTGKTVSLPVPDELVSLFRARIGELGPKVKVEHHLWPEYAAMRSGVRSNQFHALLVQCGLATARSHKATKRGRGAEREASTLSFHCLRHGFVSTLKATGASQGVAKALAGHSSDAMSDHYTSLPLETLRDAVEKLPSLGV